MNFCSNCGNGNADDATFCVQCGTSLQAPAAGAPVPPPVAPPPAFAPGPAVPPPPGYVPQQPFAGPPMPGAPAQPYYPPVAIAPPVDSMATASLIIGIVGFFFCQLLGILAIIFGYQGKRNIRESGGTLGGDSYCTIGIILGFVQVGIIALVALVWVVIIIIAAASHAAAPALLLAALL